MIISIKSQLNLILFSFLSGIITGVMFDIYRIIRGYSNPNKYITFFEDILFWILTSILVFVFLMYTNHGYISLYVYLYIAFGIYLYMRILSKSFIIVLHNVISSLLRLFRIARNVIIYPFQLVFYNIHMKSLDKKKKSSKNK